MSHTPSTLADRARFVNNAPLIIVALLTVDSLHFIFAKLLAPHLPPTTSAMYVMLVGTIEVVLIALARSGKVQLAVFWQYKWFFLSIGLLIAISTSGNYLAVSYINPGQAALLAKSAVLFGLGFGLLWLKEKLTGLQISGTFIAIMGVFTIAFQPGDYLRLGSFLVLGSVFLYSSHTALVKRYGANMDIVTFFVFRLATTSSFLLLYNLGSGNLQWPTRSVWPLLILVGTVDIVISRGLYYLALRQLKLSIHTIILTASPALAIIWTVLLFEINPTPQQLLGGGAVLIGVILVTWPRR